jgi:hypothetical protein
MRYEAIPCRLIAHGILHVAPEEDFSTPKHVRVRGVTTLQTSIENAQRRSDEWTRNVREQLRRGDHQALVDLLYDRPEFGADPWMLKEYLKWRATGRSYQKRGRKMGSFTRHPLMVAAVVEELLKRDLVNSKAAAFPGLEKRRWLSATAARDSYYRAWREERFKPVLIQDRSRARLITEQEFNQAIGSAVVLESGATITHTLAQFPEGPVTMTFDGS